MKKIFLAMFASVVMMTVNAQTEKIEVRTEGAITYEEVMKLDIVVDGMPPEMMEKMPKDTRTNTILYFNDKVCRYENLNEASDGSMEEEMGGATVKIMMSTPENIVYYDLKNRKMIQQKEFMTRKFLITSDMPKEEWKLTGNQQVILGYPCQEAIKNDTSKIVKAWFTPAIPVSTGPDEFVGLPGMVLMVDVNDGERTLTAKTVELAKVDPNKLQKPDKGKKVSLEKYLSIVDEKTKEMGSEGGEGQTIIMKISQ